MLIIFSVFALSVLMVLMLGASVYKNMTETSRDGQDERTLLSFIWTQVKNHDGDGSVRVGQFGGLNALLFEEKYGDTVYETAIYYYDGWVREIFYEKELELTPTDGERVMQVGDLTFEDYGYGLIRVQTGGRDLLISPRMT